MTHEAAIEALRGDLAAIPPRTLDGWWPIGQDDPELRRALVQEDEWWRRRIQDALDLVQD